MGTYNENGPPIANSVRTYIVGRKVVGEASCIGFLARVAAASVHVERSAYHRSAVHT
jgi:hypothetical protein